RAPCCGSAILGFGQAQTASPSVAPTIRATASEVLLDIVVRDKHGKPVRNLRPADVQIFEDGVRREAKSFRFVGARVADTRIAGATAVTATPSPAAPRSLCADNLLCIVFHNLD